MKSEHRVASRGRVGWLAAFFRGHVLLFEQRPPTTYDASAGSRLLLLFLLLEWIIGPRFSLVKWLHLPIPPPWFGTPLLLALALILVRVFARLKPSQIGSYPWREWSRTEKAYFLPLLPLLILVFSMIFAPRLQAIVADSSLWRVAGVMLFTYFVWGFYQEVVYRGILQTELVRRWGPWAGILIANTLFTFGPLHFYHFSGPAPIATFASIFAIGLFFGALFWRSGNLWIVGVFHGIGDCYFTGLATFGR